MAWTWPTAIFFIAIFESIAAMGFWEYKVPGGGPHHGVFGLDTPPGDRLFISIPRGYFIMFGWIGLASVSVWGGVVFVFICAIFVFRWV
jgi:predicted small integral membrane protein